MPKLFFIRHGQTDANVKGILTGRLESNLTQKAIEDTKMLGRNMKEEFKYYYCSPLKRTKQTLIALRGNVNYIEDERLTEVYSGDWQGKNKIELPEDEYELYKKGLLTPPNGEKNLAVETRIKSFLNDIFSKYSLDDKILVVTHNAFIRCLKRLFVDEVAEPKNLEIFIVDNEMYNDLRKRSSSNE